MVGNSDYGRRKERISFALLAPAAPNICGCLNHRGERVALLCFHTGRCTQFGIGV